MRYCIGIYNGQSVYRICEIVDLVDTPKVYKVDEQNFNQNFILKHGSSSKEWPMDRTSNSPFEQVRSQAPFLDGYSLVGPERIRVVDQVNGS